jgi:hypothetical protein
LSPNFPLLLSKDDSPNLSRFTRKPDPRFYDESNDYRLPRHPLSNLHALPLSTECDVFNVIAPITFDGIATNINAAIVKRSPLDILNRIVPKTLLPTMMENEDITTSADMKTGT